MKAIVLESPGKFQVADFQAPGNPGPDEVLVQVHRLGICGTDLHAFEGSQTFFSYPRVLGHELGVEVLEVGTEVTDLNVGDYCAVEPYLNCGECIACRHGKTNCCLHMEVLGVHVDGGMLGTILVSRQKLHKSETLSLEQLALVETVAVGAHAVHRAATREGECVLVVGAGPIGQSVIASARAEEARIAILELRKDRLEFCRETVEGCHLLHPGEDLVAQLQNLFEGDLPTTVFDCTGSPHSMMASFNYVAHGGKLVFVGHFPGEITFHDPHFHGREMTLMASRNATADDMRRVIGWMESGRLDVRNWITHRVELPRFVETFPGWLDPEAGVFKGMVEWP